MTVQGTLNLWHDDPPLPAVLADLDTRHPGALVELLAILREQAATGRASAKHAIETWRAARRPTGTPVGIDNKLGRPLALYAIAQEPWLAEYIETRGGRP